MRQMNERFVVGATAKKKWKCFVKCEKNLNSMQKFSYGEKRFWKEAKKN